ncbi:hypothetical protein INT45_007104 [Circinella minor]|uniref:Uncharacterized protein n=1 Tax=Circinella minor TaxID=1195481 RepID=A0A8H7VMA0_9FUNG|nr:hypothetical protein INT45_007104 [Circinella minor]
MAVLLTKAMGALMMAMTIKKTVLTAKKNDNKNNGQQQPQIKDEGKMIDGSAAPMEMLLHSVLPSMPEVEHKFDINNAYDEVLQKAYKHHSCNDITNRKRGMQILRKFVWKHPQFPKGTFNDTAQLFEHFISNMSNEMQQLFAVESQRIVTCADKKSHAVVHEEESGYKKKESRKCAVALCPSLATRKSTLTSFPRFLFLQDHTATQTGDKMLE